MYSSNAVYNAITTSRRRGGDLAYKADLIEIHAVVYGKYLMQNKMGQKVFYWSQSVDFLCFALHTSFRPCVEEQNVSPLYAFSTQVDTCVCQQQNKCSDLEPHQITSKVTTNRGRMPFVSIFCLTYMRSHPLPPL